MEACGGLRPLSWAEMARPQVPWLPKNIHQFIFSEWTWGGRGRAWQIQPALKIRIWRLKTKNPIHLFEHWNFKKKCQLWYHRRDAHGFQRTPAPPAPEQRGRLGNSARAGARGLVVLPEFFTFCFFKCKHFYSLYFIEDDVPLFCLFWSSCIPINGHPNTQWWTSKHHRLEGPPRGLRSQVRVGHGGDARTAH